MKAVISWLAAITIFMSVWSPSLAQPPHFLNDVNVDRNSSGPPMYNSTPWRFHYFSTQGTPWTELTWHTDFDNLWNSRIAIAMAGWTNLSNWPSYAGISQTETTEANADIVFRQYEHCSNINTQACAAVTEWWYDPNDLIYVPKKFDIKYPSYGLHSNNKRLYVLSHEIGHVLGLNEGYHENLTCGGQATVMDAGGCNSLTLPGTYDNWKISKYYRFCNGNQIQCGSVEPPYAPAKNGTLLTSSWPHKAHFSRWAYFTYKKSETWNGTYTTFYTQVAYPNMFWEDLYYPPDDLTQNTYNILLQKDVGPLTDHDYVKICGRLKLPWTYWSIERCTPTAIYVY